MPSLPQPTSDAALLRGRSSRRSAASTRGRTSGERQLRDLVANKPFLRSKNAPKTLYVTFLAEEPDRKRVRQLPEGSFEPERFDIVGEDVHLFFPNATGG